VLERHMEGIAHPVWQRAGSEPLAAFLAVIEIVPDPLYRSGQQPFKQDGVRVRLRNRSSLCPLGLAAFGTAS